MSTKVYTYRTTTDKIGAAYEAVESSGHSVEHVVFQGGRDFVLICREDPSPVIGEIKFEDVRDVLSEHGIIGTDAETAFRSWCRNPLGSDGIRIQAALRARGLIRG